MVAKMTSNLGQIALAVVAALAITFPTPEEAKQAILEAVRGDHPEIVVKATSEEVLIAAPNFGHVTSLTYDPAAECLISVGAPPPELIETCVRQLFDELNTRPLYRPGIDGPVPASDGRSTDIYEAKRLALSKLCRSLWIASGGSQQSLDMAACQFAVSGLEQTVEMR